MVYLLDFIPASVIFVSEKEHKETLKKKRRGGKKQKKRFFFYCEGSQRVAQVAQRGCGVSVCGDIQNPTGHSPERPAVGDSAWARGLRWGLWGASQPQRPGESLRIPACNLERYTALLLWADIRSHVWILILDCLSYFRPCHFAG